MKFDCDIGKNMKRNLHQLAFLPYYDHIYLFCSYFVCLSNHHLSLLGICKVIGNAFGYKYETKNAGNNNFSIYSS